MLTRTLVLVGTPEPQVPHRAAAPVKAAIPILVSQIHSTALVVLKDVRWRSV